jgi:uncharacterized membrane protein
MMAILRYVGTTILGGVLFLAPIVVLVLVLGKVFNFLRPALQPVTALIPQNLVSGPTTTAILAILLLALVCFLAGLSARTALAQTIVRHLEEIVLSKVPGYEYLKEAGTSVLGLGEAAEHPVVFVHLGGAWRVGVQTDVVGGGLVAVFIPNSPNPISGSVFLVASDRVRPANAPLASAMACLRRCGLGAASLAGEFALSEPAP